MKIIRYVLFACSFSLILPIYGQSPAFKKRIPLLGQPGTWNEVILNDSVLSEVNIRMSDIRIWGHSPDGDTIEAPFLIRHFPSNREAENYEFTLLNKGLTEGKHTFTFKLNEAAEYNQVNLDILNANFDWKVKVEGSLDQHSWTQLVDNYRIVGFDFKDLSVGNDTDVDYPPYRFTKLIFPLTNFPYLRISMSGVAAPQLGKATISKIKFNPAVYDDIKTESLIFPDSKNKKETVIEIPLPSRIPVNYLKLKFSDTVDFIRNASIFYLSDSVQTENGWIRNYRAIDEMFVSSFEENEFEFSGVFTSLIRVVIHNQDNLPLELSSVKLRKYRYQVIFRAAGEGLAYYLYYGSENAFSPQYDIVNFEEKISKTPVKLELGTPESIYKKKKRIAPLFDNPFLMWGLLGVVALLLGFFTIKMLKGTD